MNITIYTLNFVSQHRPDAPFNVSFNPLEQDQKATTFIGHPHDRRSPPDSTRQWNVTVPDSAELEGDKLKWIDGEETRWLSADEVYSLAKRGLHGFSFANA
jgi:hypothetical protein